LHLYFRIHENKIIFAIAVVLILILVTTSSSRIFANTAAAGPKQQQLSTIANDTNNTIRSNSRLLSSSSTNTRPNILTDFNPGVIYPTISKFAYVDPLAVIIGDCEIGKLVLIAPFAVCRGDEGTPIHIGDYSNMQDGVLLHALETTAHGKNIDDRRYSAEGSLLKANDSEFKNGFAISVGDKVSLAHSTGSRTCIYWK